VRFGLRFEMDTVLDRIEALYLSLHDGG